MPSSSDLKDKYKWKVGDVKINYAPTEAGMGLVKKEPEKRKGNGGEKNGSSSKDRKPHR
jgi:hypothetical protein